MTVENIRGVDPFGFPDCHFFHGCLRFFNEFSRHFHAGTIVGAFSVRGFSTFRTFFDMVVLVGFFTLSDVFALVGFIGLYILSDISFHYSCDCVS